jgi:hypothetical protein
VISITCREPHLVFGARQKKIGAPNGGADGALPFAPCDPRRFGDLTYRPAVDRPNVTTEPRRFPRTQTTVAVKTTNVVPSDKFVRLLRGVIADAENVVILRLRIGDDELQVKSREISLHPIAPTLRIGSTALSMSSARLARISERLFRMPSGARGQRIMQARQMLHPLRNLARSDATHLTGRQKDAIATILSQGISLIG